jgi:hypothetical protein
MRQALQGYRQNIIEAVIAANFKHIYLSFLDDGKDKTKTTKFAINTVR